LRTPLAYLTRVPAVQLCVARILATVTPIQVFRDIVLRAIIAMQHKGAFERCWTNKCNCYQPMDKLLLNASLG
jgi:hypothetical protein